MENDPRPDLIEDSELWTTVLRIADSNLVGVLNAMRCGGTRLVKKKGKYKLEPIIDPKIGWGSEEEYHRVCNKWLLPIAIELTNLFAQIDDAIAKEAGLLVCIAGELYMRDVSSNAAVFVERLDGNFNCYRLVWYDAVDGTRRIKTEKFYARDTTFHEAVKKAQQIIQFYEKIKGG